MLEMMLCSLFTIVPDYLYRRYAQGKRFGQEINLYTVWFELRWGITGCIILTVLLITTVFYNHPATTNVTLYFRTVPIISEAVGRVAEIFVPPSGPIKAGDPIFRLDNTKQVAAVETAKSKIAEVEASLAVAKADVMKAEGQVQEAQGNVQQAQDELDTKLELQRRNAGVVAQRDIEKLQVRVSAAEGSLAAANAAKQAAEIKVSQVLPAEKASAEAELGQAQVELDKTVVRAGVDGRVEQFFLRVGDIVNPVLRPAGVLIPAGAGQRGLQAGFNQIEAQIMKAGMIAEVTCVSKPFTVIPMVVTDVQDYIAAGQFRGGEQLIDPNQVARPGTLLAFLEPLYKGGLDGVTPGSSCIANAYSNNHDAIHDPATGTMKGIALHAVDALALVHALILRLQALVLPFKTLVFAGH
ncbi:MAG: HlyD family secretion protein [Xanthobacteraceae bacterium]